MNGKKRIARHTDSFFQKSKGKEFAKKQKIVLATAFIGVFVFSISMLQMLLIRDDNMLLYIVKAYYEVNAYHGIQTIYCTNGKGEKSMQSVREVWADSQGRYYIKELEGLNQGIITINNGDNKWQQNPNSKIIQILPVHTNSFPFLFEIGNEISSIQAIKKIKEVEKDTVAGRKAKVFKVIPRIGDPYCLWIDEETKLPIKKRTALQDGIACEITYTQIEFSEIIPSTILTLEQPDGYTVRTNQTEQVVSGTEEAYGLIGVKASLPVAVPENYLLYQTVAEVSERITKLYYMGQLNKEVVIIDIKNAVEELKPNPLAILGTVNSSQAEILVRKGKSQAVVGGGLLAISEVNSIRWQEEGKEYRVYGSIGIDLLAEFAEGISKGEVVFPETRQDIFKPEVTLEYDKEIEENEQKNVDAGHSPWKLDPVFVSQVFVSTIMKPGGIQGEYPIAYEDITIIMNTGDAAIAKINNEISPIKNVYLRKLIRQDETGIWTVVGYDKK